ncbi:MAG TPA: PEP-CTERM sorting domain-containing protein [Bryobacteraceae bacterium]
MITGLLLLGAAVLATPALASDVACSSPQPLNAAMGTGATNGCTYVDNNFLNFAAAAPTGSADGNFPTLTGGFAPSIEFVASGLLPTYTLDFTTTGAPNSAVFSCNANSWCTSGLTTPFTASQSLTYDATTASGYNGLSLTDGALQTAFLNTDSVITTEEQFCLGGASVAGCAAADLGYIEITETGTGGGTPTYNTVYTVCTPGAGGCTITNPGSATVTFATQLQIGIEDTITISNTLGEDRAVFLDSFDNTFDVLPEPSTFALLGIGLAGFGILGSRRKRA